MLPFSLCLKLSNIGSSPTQCTFAINQLSRGRNREERENSELSSLAAKALLKNYRRSASSKVPLLTSLLQNMKLVNWFSLGYWLVVRFFLALTIIATQDSNKDQVIIPWFHGCSLFCWGVALHKLKMVHAKPETCGSLFALFPPTFVFYN